MMRLEGWAGASGASGWISFFILIQGRPRGCVEPRSDKLELPFVRSLGLQFGKWTREESSG